MSYNAISSFLQNINQTTNKCELKGTLLLTFNSLIKNVAHSSVA